MQEDKQLLLQDLCARLPYGVICKVKYILNNETTYGEDIERECTDVVKRINFDKYTVYTEWLRDESDIEEIKPYLRPMYSMTEEEVKEYKAFHCVAYEHTHFYPQFCTVANELNMFDWLNKKMFDYRGLIGKDLALEAPEDMYKKIE